MLCLVPRIAQQNSALHSQKASDDVAKCSAIWSPLPRVRAGSSAVCTVKAHADCEAAVIHTIGVESKTGPQEN